MNSVIVCVAGAESSSRCRFYALLTDSSAIVELLCQEHRTSDSIYDREQQRYISEAITPEQRTVRLLIGGIPQPPAEPMPRSDAQ